MPKVTVFETPHGKVLIETLGGSSPHGEARSQGGGRLSKEDMQISQTLDADEAEKSITLVRAPKSFDQAMSSVRAYVSNLDDFIKDLDVLPETVSVDLGLKLIGSAGFVIAKAGAETELRISLTWKPRKPDLSS
jgi:hypothetical protein